MTAAVALFLLAGFQLKHFLADFLWQTGWMISGKQSRYLAPGSLAHAGLHAALSLPVLLLGGAGPTLALLLALAEWAIHLHIDWAKSLIERGRGLTPRERGYWQLFGLDQLAHQLTYLALVAVLLAASGNG